MGPGEAIGGNRDVRPQGHREIGQADWVAGGGRRGSEFDSDTDVEVAGVRSGGGHELTVAWSTEVDTAELKRRVVRLDGVDGNILGTGVSVAPGLVLTCAHVVKNGRTMVSVVPASGGPRRGTVEARSIDPPAGWEQPVWPFPDLAIVSYQGAPIDSYALLQSRGVPGQQTDCVAWGYPHRRHGVAPIGDPAAFRFTGVTGDGFLALKADVARPGLSGAPLVCTERRAVLGLVEATRGAESPLGGWASPISGLTHPDAPPDLRSAGANLLTANREVVVADRASWHAVLPVAGAENAVGQSWGTYVKGKRANPADLLVADFGVVTYLFRDHALEAAEDWCLEPDPIAVATLSATGGAGKTRFAVELCQRMVQRHRWIAGEVMDLAENGIEVATLPLPRLLVVDYAEAKTATSLQAMLEQLRLRATEMAPARILLVTRERAGQVAVEASTVGAIRSAASVALKRVLDDRDDNQTAVGTLDHAQRELLYDTAVKDFAAAWRSPVPGGRPDLDAADYSQPLPILFEALDAVLEADPTWSSTVIEPDDPFWGPEPIYRILAHEETYWRLTAPLEDRTLLRECAAVATLAGASTAVEGDALLKSIPSLDSDEHQNADRRARLTAWLADLYRGRSLLNPLRPDRLGEALVRAGFIARYGAEGLQRVLAATTLAQTARALTVLTRSSSQSIAAFDAIARTLARCHSELVSRLPEPTTPRRELDGDTSYA
ncbi:MAG TPA: serine protease, partial [Microlunatus sp.]|nr:serine protease [Microlunatus sp.]